MRLGTADETAVGEAADVEQAESRKEKKSKEKSLRMLNPGVDSPL